MKKLKKKLPDGTIINTTRELFKPKEITPLVARAIDMHILGRTLEDACTRCHLEKEHVERIINSPRGVEYIERALVALEGDIPVNKKQLIMELYTRLHGANNRDAVSIVSQISKMCEFEENEKTQIAIVFNEDPWLTKKQ